MPINIAKEDYTALEQFVVVMYDRSSTATGVDEARLDLFARKQKPYNAIPPTGDALKKHIMRAAYQAGYVWGQSTTRNPEPCSPGDWGWMKDGDTWIVNWMALAPIAENCQELTRCGCKKECNSQRCKCFRSALACTVMCNCPCDK